MNKSSFRDQFRVKKMGIIILIILYIVGAIGYISPLSEWFLYLTPVNLVITAGLIWIDTKPGTHSGWPVALGIIFLAYLMEIAGVKTGLLFGNYSYGEVLGWKFFEVPPVIGINWLILVWGGYSFWYSLGISPKFRWLLNASLLTILDYLIEPVAMHYGFWSWGTPSPPTQNYIAWFVAAGIFTLIFEKYPIVQKPRMGVVTIVCQFLFFGFLNIFS